MYLPYQCINPCSVKSSHKNMDLMLPRCQQLMQHHYYLLFNKNNSRLVASLPTKKCFRHPWGIESASKNSKEWLPPFLRDNKDLHTKFVRHFTLNFKYISIDLAREFVIDTLISQAKRFPAMAVEDVWNPITINNVGVDDALQLFA